MIDKLYNLKKLQTQQELLQKQQLLAKMSSIEDEMELTHKNISTASVQSIGAISDFRILEIHKNTMKSHIATLSKQKVHLVKEVEKHNKALVELNKQTEQYKYILVEENKVKFKKMIKDEEIVSSEYMQAKWKVS